jgi:hypothetical protein
VNFCHQFYVVRNTTPGKMSWDWETNIKPI